MKKEIYPKVFAWLMVGLLVTFITGYGVSLSNVLLEKIASGPAYIIIIILELGAAIFLSTRIDHMSKSTAMICYLLYSFLTGLTFSSIFITYKLTSIMIIFLVTAIIFGIFAWIGKTTKKDLSGIGNFLLMAIIGIILMSIINIFLRLPMIQLIISIIGILVFIGYIMYDVQKLPLLIGQDEEKGAIYGAFHLYIDFINIFIELLELFGDRD